MASNMARLSLECRWSVIMLRSRGYTVSGIQWRLCEENISVSYQALHNLLHKFCYSLLWEICQGGEGHERLQKKTKDTTFLPIHCSSDLKIHH